MDKSSVLPGTLRTRGIDSYILLAKWEEAFNIAKWGDEYRQYMKDIPRFNIVLGLWRLVFRSG